MQTALTDMYLTIAYILVTQMVVVIAYKQDIKNNKSDSHYQILWHYSSSHRLRNESSLNLELWLQEPVPKEKFISPNNSKNCSSTSQNNYDTDINVDKMFFLSSHRAA